MHTCNTHTHTPIPPIFPYMSPEYMPAPHILPHVLVCSSVYDSCQLAGGQAWQGKRTRNLALIENSTVGLKEWALLFLPEQPLRETQSIPLTVLYDLYFMKIESILGFWHWSDNLASLSSYGFSSFLLYASVGLLTNYNFILFLYFVLFCLYFSPNVIY
jgi:hypothetical protein